MINNEIIQVCINMYDISREYIENDIYNEEILKDTLHYLIKLYINLVVISVIIWQVVLITC